MPENKIFHWRHLPDYYPEDTVFFVTYRLAGSKPAEVIRRLKEIRDQQKNGSKGYWEHRFTDYERYRARQGS
jgi:hypothetical protein